MGTKYIVTNRNIADGFNILVIETTKTCQIHSEEFDLQFQSYDTLYLPFAFVRLASQLLLVRNKKCDLFL